MTMGNVLQELDWRGFVQQATPGLDAHFAKGPVIAYCGFDPTVRSLQVGNLMPLMLLANLQRHGHRPIVLMGGGTGLIGDPSGKSAERPLLSKEEIRENVRRMRDQSARFLEFGAGPTAALLLDNAKWLGEQHLIDFLRDIGKHFSVNVMMQKESVKARLAALIPEMAEQKKSPATRPAQRLLAAAVTTRLHGAEVLSGVQAASAILFGEEQAEVRPQVFDILSGEIPTVEIAGDQDVALVDL